ncbi:MauE/DoxX family redox-associated membrane protein [Zunongwangia endophytica]|uniref:MauE/DoxX family redox-associated membrane protein n=1 Tax=Zunongwangia endophytica TaxID=1808945 RepID=A0ABV8HBX8_9FLAO|nr:MauE/DoxX family redox-associated membrane protein [Zunongwangia endophytica]MDN3594389.1 hypothetical protein [Zunongwangia endophytica]
MKPNSKNWRLRETRSRQQLFSYVSKVLLFYFVLLLTYTGISKITELKTLYTTLINAPLYLDNELATIGQWLIPISEIALALSISFKKTRKIGYLGITSLFILLSLYSGWINWFLPNKPCSCGGLISLLSWKQHVLFNLINLLLALTAWYITEPKD